MLTLDAIIFKRRPAVPAKPNIARGLPLELMQEGALAAARKAARLAGSPTLEQYVKAACELVKEPTASLLFDSIFRRMRCAVDLVERYSHNVKAIS